MFVSEVILPGGGLPAHWRLCAVFIETAAADCIHADVELFLLVPVD